MALETLAAPLRPSTGEGRQAALGRGSGRPGRSGPPGRAALLPGGERGAQRRQGDAGVHWRKAPPGRSGDREQEVCCQPRDSSAHQGQAKQWHVARLSRSSALRSQGVALRPGTSPRAPVLPLASSGRRLCLLQCGSLSLKTLASVLRPKAAAPSTSSPLCAGLWGERAGHGAGGRGMVPAWAGRGCGPAESRRTRASSRPAQGFSEICVPRDKSRALLPLPQIRR